MAKRRPLEKRESAIQAEVLDYLRLVRRWMAWRQNTGAAKMSRPGEARRFVRFSPPGMSDVCGVIPDGGRFLCVEVKRPGEIPTPAQADWLALVAAAGGLAVVATSVDDLRAALAHAGYPEGGAGPDRGNPNE